MARTIWMISQYASTPETGMGGRHYYFAKELAKRGFNVSVVAAAYTHLLRKPPEVRGKFTVEFREGFHFVWIRTLRYADAHGARRAVNWFLFSFSLSRLPKIIGHKPDVILYSSPSLVGFLGAEWLARRLGAKLALEVRDIWPLSLCAVGGYSARHPFIRLLQYIEDRAYRVSDHVFSNLKSANRHMVAHGLDRRKFKWIPNGFSLAEASSAVSLDPDIASLLPGEGFIVGYVGAIGVANNLSILVEAADLLREHLDIKFAVVGDGKERGNLERLARERKLSNMVFTGPVPKKQVQSVLQLFDALFIGLKKDPVFEYGVSPNKLFDYLYAAKPVLYAIGSGDYRPVEDAGAGLTVPPENAPALADAILRLRQVPAREREEMGRRGREAAIMQHEYGMLAERLAAALFPPPDGRDVNAGP